MPRLAPPTWRVKTVIEGIEEQLGVEVAENGRIALRGIAVVFQELMSRKLQSGMPSLSVSIDGDLRTPFVLMWDATGFRKLQLSTMAVRDPFSVQSGTHLHLLGRRRQGWGDEASRQGEPLSNQALDARRADGRDNP